MWHTCTRSFTPLIRQRRPLDGASVGRCCNTAQVVMCRRHHPPSITGSYNYHSRSFLRMPTSQLLLTDTTTCMLSTCASVVPKDGPNFNASKVESGGGDDDRARAKLVALSEAKKVACDAQAAFLKCTTTGEGKVDELYERWKFAEHNLGIAYSQAIKYTSRIHHDEEATKTAERIMYQWMDRVMESFGSSLVWMKDIEEAVEDSSTMYLNKKWMIRSIHSIASRLTTSRTESSPGGDVKIFPKIRLSPPSSKDYINLLRAYSNSKARRKGQQCEAIIKSMMMLANTVACHYNRNDAIWTEENACDTGREILVGVDGKETEQWKVWVHESIPNSKAFALAIKCHAGTTRPESLERIILLNHIHDAFTDCLRPHISGMYKDDPYVLLHSIKALKNLQKKEEWDLGHEWLGKLHGFITNAENKEYFQGDEMTHGDGLAIGTSNVLNQTESNQFTFCQTIDVTSAYTTMMRLISRLRGTKGVATNAFDVLSRMHRVHDIFINGLEPRATCTDDSTQTSFSHRPKCIASIDIRSNVYNLLLSLYKDSKNADDATKAVQLLQRMVDAGKKEPEDRGGVPLPTEQSFEFTIMSLANMVNADLAFNEAERLITLMHEQKHLKSSVSSYNAFIVVCNKQLFGKIQLYDKSLEILDRMTELAKSNPSMLPNPETLALVMKACSLSEHTDHQRVLDTASNLFSQLKNQEPSEKSNVALTDRAFYYMMNCVEKHMTGDYDAKKERLHELFSEACQRGLCSANVLTQFRKSVSDEEYHLTVGRGRLADHWIANITGPRALYTDGSKGGAGKNARRKGKSTSDWAKKAKSKELLRVARRNDKKTKKDLKKMGAV